MKVKIDKEQIFFGSLLGDACIKWPKHCKNPNFCERHGLKQRDYLLWKKQHLSFSTKYREDLYGKSPGCYIYSSHKAMFKKYYEWKYRNTIEIVKRLKMLGLLIWYLDDGNYHYGTNRLSLFIRPVLNDIEIKKWLYSEYWVESKVYKNSPERVGNSLILPSSATKQLLILFSPYIPMIPQNMYYKFGLDGNRKEKALKRGRDYQREQRHLLGISKKYIGKYQK